MALIINAVAAAAGRGTPVTGTKSALPPFRAPFAPPDEELAAGLLAAAVRDGAAERRIDARARALVEAIRAKTGGLGGVEDFLHAYSLSTKEGLALMVLAEALLRVPDAATADRLIEDKLAAGRWLDGDVKSTALLVSASAWTLGIAARVIHPGETPETILDAIVKRLGLPALRTATRQAMRLIGSHFVLGETIAEALARGRGHAEFRYSFDMLGEGARTAADADQYFDAYAGAIEAIGASAGNAALPARPGISVKLTALHPRFEAVSRTRVLAELPPRLIALAQLAKAHDLQFTVDAEEADRLELSLEVIGAALADPSLRGWEGFGLAVQAYQKRALAVIAWVEEAAAAFGSRLTVRLVKGAYWDTEIKRAQERGLPDYPVFTRKAMTDLCYMACVKKLLAARGRLYPQFATHNALTVASVIEDAGGVEGFEFQRLYGMGEALYGALLAELPDAACRVYAPVGGHRDLLAYLVRRLLENGANSSFVSVAADPSVPDRRYSAPAAKPDRRCARRAQPKNPAAARPLCAGTAQLAPASSSASGQASTRFSTTIRAGTQAAVEAAPLIDGVALAGIARRIVSPIDGRPVGVVQRGRCGDRARGDGGRRGRVPGLVGDARGRARRGARTRRRSARAGTRPVARIAAERGRQDARRCARRTARGDRLLPLLRGAGAHGAGAAGDAGPDRRKQSAALSRSRRLRLHQPMEFSAGDLPRPGDRRARRRQHGRRQAGRADAARSPRAPSRSCMKPACR